MINRPRANGVHPDTAAALHVLILCEMDHYSELAGELVNSLSPDVGARLAAAFEKLMSDNGLAMEHGVRSRRVFARNLDKFVASVAMMMNVR